MLLVIARHLIVYGAAGSLILFLADRYVHSVSRRVGLLLIVIPLGLTGRAVLTGDTYGPIDISFQTDPLKSIRAEFGIAEPARAVLGDVVYQGIPWRKAAREAVKNGRLPIWNRFILGGEPLAAVMQSAVLHPFTWIGMLLPLDQAWTLEMSLGVLLALVSAFLLLSDLGMSAGASMLGGIAWAFCDYLRFYAGWSLSPAAAVFPLFLLGLRRIAQRRGGIAIAVVALSLCVAAGHPETALHLVCGGGIWFLVQLFDTKAGSRWRSFGEALLAGVLASGVTAILLLPHVEALHQTWEYFFRTSWWVHQHKGSSMAEAMSTVQQAIVPYALGIAGYGQTALKSQVPQAYLGSVALPLATIGLASRRREKWACIAMAIVGFGAWSHFPVLTDVIASLPLLDMAVNERLVFLACFSIALLAGMGAELLLGNTRYAIWAASVWTALILVIYRSSLVRLAALGMPSDFRIFLLLAQLIPLLLVIGLWAVTGGRPKAVVIAVTAVILLGERVTETWHIYPTAPRTAFYPHLRLLDPIARGAPYRMAALGMAFLPNVSTMYEVEDIRGYEAMTFLPLFETYPIWSIHQPVWFNRIDDPTRPFLSFLNVKYFLAAPGVATPPGWAVLASEPGGNLVQNPNALERAFIPRELQIEPESPLRLAKLAAIQDFAQQGILSDGPAKMIGSWRANGRGTLAIVEYRGDYVRLKVHATDDLVVGTSIPAWIGWIGRLDGSRKALLRYNHAFLGARVPAGDHELEIRYLPTSVIMGALISAATALALFAFAAIRRSGRPAQSPGVCSRSKTSSYCGNPENALVSAPPQS